MVLPSVLACTLPALSTEEYGQFRTQAEIIPEWTSHRQWNYVHSPSQGYYWHLPNASSERTCYLNAPSEKCKYLLLDTSNAVTGNEAPPSNSVPINTIRLTATILRISQPPRMAAPPAAPVPTDLTAYLNSQLDTYLVRHIYALQPTHKLQAALASGSCIQVLYTGTTDGNYGWNVSADGRPQQNGHGIAYGQPMSSFCAGAYGLLSALTFLQHYAEFFQTQVPPEICLILASDQHKIANRIIHHRQRTISRPRYFIDADHDIVMELVHHLDSSPHFIVQQWSIRPYRPQQKKTTPDDDSLATTNQLANRMTAQHRHHSPQQMPPLPACPAYLVQNNRLITSNERQLLSTAISQKALLNYLQHRRKWTSRTMQKVNLEAFQAARKRCPPHRAQFVTRFIHGHLPTRARCYITGSASTDHCPLCQKLETQDHLSLCPQQQQWRADFLTQLTQHLIAT
jgi:hypothetical protein